MMPGWLIFLLRTFWRIKAVFDWLATVTPDPRQKPPSEQNPMGGA